MKKILSLASVLALVCGVSLEANASGTTGTHNGYYWFTYYTGSGTTTYTPGTSGSNFKGTWTSGVTDSLVGTGWYPGSVRTIGYNCGQLSGSWHTAGVYFWAPYPNKECYITDFGSNGGTFEGTVNSDGGTYNIYLGSQGGGPQFKDSRTSSQSIGANHNLGLLLASEGRVDAAISEFTAAVKLDPDYADAHNNLGVALAMGRHFDEAILQYRAAIALKPNNAVLRKNLGVALWEKRQVNEAIAEFTKAIQLQPDLTEAQERLKTALQSKANPNS